jgi:1-deoxy-D-xylulose-5-phosphate reductoisomerase
MGKRIAILGSTGSIGKNALRVIEALGPQYEVAALSAHGNADLLAEQARRYRPRVIAITNTDCFEQVHSAVSDLNVEVLSGPDSLVQVAALADVDIVLTAVVGAAGLPAVLAAAHHGKRLAIANKEPLVIAGELLTAEAQASKAEILPVDSEHSAIFQAMLAGSREQVSKIVLTSSGGPFRKFSPAEIEDVTLQEALCHPVWDMGRKITVDSRGTLALPDAGR